MPSLSSDAGVEPTVENRYGPAGFIAAAVTVTVLELLAWVFLLWAWYLVPAIVLPAVIVDLLIGYGLTRVNGTAGQVGRGMVIGGIAAPLTVLLFIPCWLAAGALGLV